MEKRMPGPIVVGVQWSQSGHAMLRHRVANNEHAGQRGPTQRGGRQNLKCAGPLSEVRKIVLILGSSFRKQETEKINYYSMHVFGGFELKSSCCQEDASAFLTQGILDPRATPC